MNKYDLDLMSQLMSTDRLIQKLARSFCEIIDFWVVNNTTMMMMILYF